MARLSRKGAKFIARFEGFRSCPYQDAVGVWTIGYGHTRGVWSKHVEGRRKPLCISERKARRLLRKDAAPVVRAIYDAKPDRMKLAQHELDALTSFGFNLGAGIFGPDYTIGRALRNGDRKAIAAAILLYDHAGDQRLDGLTRRRLAERRVFRHGYRR